MTSWARKRSRSGCRADQLDEVGEHVGVAAHRQLGVDEALVGGEHQLLQAGDGVTGEPGVGEVAERRPATSPTAARNALAGGGVVAPRPTPARPSATSRSRRRGVDQRRDRAAARSPAP